MRSSPLPAAAANGSRPTLLAIVLLLVHGVLAWWLRIPSITMGNDDATYLLLARAIRRLSYAELWIAGAPPHTKYPPLFPATLAAVQSVTGEHLDVVLAVNILLSMAALGLLYLAVSRWSRWLALAVVAVCAVNPSLVVSAGRVHSEPLFMLLANGSLWFLSAPTPTRRTRTGAAMAAIAAALTRSIGVTIIGAVLIHWLVRRQYRAAGALVLATSLTAGPWLTWTTLAPKQLAGYSYLADALHQTPPGAPTGAKASAKKARTPPGSRDSGRARDSALARDTSSRTPSGEDTATVAKTAGTPPRPVEGRGGSSFIRVIATRVAKNVPAYLTRELPTTLALPTIGGTSVDNWAWLAMIVLFGAAGVVALAGTFSPVLLFLACYGALLTLWPYVITRYLVPCVPWLVLLLLSGSTWIAGRRDHWRRAVLPALLVSMMFASSVAKLSSRIRSARMCDRIAPLTDPDCFAEPERTFFAAALESGRATPPSAVFVSSKEGTLYYLSGRRSVQELEAVQLDAPRLRTYLRARGAEFILLSHTHVDQWALARPLRALCTSLEVVRVFAGHTVLLRLVPGTARDGGRAGCAAIERYAAAPW